MIAKKDVIIDFDKRPKVYHVVIANLICKYVRRGKVLDIGVGFGYIPKLIKGKNANIKITVIDTDINCLEITSKRVDVEKTLHTENISGILRYGKFDAVILSHSLEHMHNPYETVQIAMKLLKKDGVLVLAVPNPVRPNIFVGNILKKHYVNKGHVYAWDRSHWINFLENILKLNVLEYAEDHVQYLPGRIRELFFKYVPIIGQIIIKSETYLAKLVPWWSFSNIAVIKKS
jgi:2-polyprenyl-3-methyl-5-hydroxy-6-metoxy-1,4-benzoquinol methylase